MREMDDPFIHLPTVNRCIDAIGRERAKPPTLRRAHLVTKWTNEIRRTGGFLELPGAMIADAH